MPYPEAFRTMDQPGPSWPIYPHHLTSPTSSKRRITQMRRLSFKRRSKNPEKCARRLGQPCKVSECGDALQVSPLAPWTGCPATGAPALRHEPRAKAHRPAHVGANPVADHPVQPFRKVTNLNQDLTTEFQNGQPAAPARGDLSILWSSVIGAWSFTCCLQPGWSGNAAAVPPGRPR